MICSEIISKLEELSPTKFAEKWDNVGLLAGRSDKEVQRVMIALDATSDVIGQAVHRQADFLLTHHPLLFSPLKQIRSDDYVGGRLMKLVQKDISYYAMHTNFDVMGMADAAADELDLKNRDVLQVNFVDEISKEGIGRYGRLPYSMSLGDFADYVKSVFDVDQVCVYGDSDQIVEVCAVLPGSGKDEIDDAVNSGADVYLSGDIGHHAGIDAMEKGIAVVDAGHYGLEKIFMPYMHEFFKREFPELEVILANQNAPFSYR